MPNNLVLVRHGESEGNLANHRSRNGDNSAFTPEFLGRHSSTWRLTNRGIDQAKKAGLMIRKLLPGVVFHRCYVSEYFRALETAYYLNREEQWYPDFYLREREWGALDVLPADEREKRFAAEMKRRDICKFYHSPQGGESMAAICSNRIDRVLATLHRECDGKDVLIVCHGEVMDAFRVRLERIRSFDYDVYDSDPVNKIRNGQVIHYTRLDPESDEQYPYLEWRRMWWPENQSDNPLSLHISPWQSIIRHKFNSLDLKEVFDRQSRQVN